MFVSDLDRILLHGGFDEIDGIDPDRMWILKHVPNNRLFGLYYLKMNTLVRDFGVDFFADAFISHTGTSCTRFAIKELVKRLDAVQVAVQEATSKKDMAVLSRLKLAIPD